MLSQSSRPSFEALQNQTFQAMRQALTSPRFEMFADDDVPTAAGSISVLLTFNGDERKWKMSGKKVVSISLPLTV